MLIIIWYILFLGSASLIFFGVGFDLDSFTHVLTYPALILILMFSFVFAVLLLLSSVRLYGEIRDKYPTNNKHNHYIANSLLTIGAYFLRLKVITTGKENLPTGNFVLMGNHQENYDIIIVKPILKDYTINFIGKKSLFKAPFIGKWMSIIGNIPISPFADRSAAESIVKGIKSVKSGNPIGIFPEGKRSFSNEMIEFKPGAFKLAMKSKTDILIVTFYDAAKIKMRIPLRKQKVYVHFNQLLRYEEFKDLSSQELSSKVKAIIQEKLDDFKAQLG